MIDYKLRVGVVAIRRLIKEPPKRIGLFQSDYAVDSKDATLKFLRENYQDENTEFFDINWLNEEGLLRFDKDCDKVVDYFKEKKVNALFILNCNFGEESVAGIVAKKMQVPTLLWGPRDRFFDDEQRYTDTQCGLFAMSKQLKRNNVKFSYIENCDLTDPAFATGVERFLGVACMVNNFKNIRILEIGARLKPFKSIMYNELELCEKFGVDIVSINLVETMNTLKAMYEEKQELLEKELVDLKKTYDCGTLDDVSLKKILTVVHYFEDLSKTYGSNIIGTDCWSGFASGWGVPPCLAMSIVADKGIFVTCEGDILMSITNVLLISATRGKGRAIQGEFTSRHPENDNAELLWHCGVFPLSCKADDEKAKIFSMKPSYRVKDGRYTIARFQAEKGKYYLLGGEFNTCKGPKTFGTYMWAEFNDLPKLERKLIEGPYIHHVTEIYGEYDSYLREFAKYFDDIIYDNIYD